MYNTDIESVQKTDSNKELPKLFLNDTLTLEYFSLDLLIVFLSVATIAYALDCSLGDTVFPASTGVQLGSGLESHFWFAAFAAKHIYPP